MNRTLISEKQKLIEAALRESGRDGVESKNNNTSKVKVSWRNGKPDEDPEKMKKWGFIMAQPSEYLVHYRKGKLREKSSGQGKSCFKLPWWDTVAVIPTTIKEVLFESNQITKDNVEVRIRGLVVYHISDPLKIYKLINFSYRERAEQKLAEAIGDMCRSTTKWLVANLSVEECIRKRKEEMADTLKNELRAILNGDNLGFEGWGVNIDNIDIQDVYIIDDEIYNAMQAKFKNEITYKAEMSRMQSDRDIEEKKIANEKEVRNLEIEAEAEMAKLELEKQKQKSIQEQKNKEEIAAIEKGRIIKSKENEIEINSKESEKKRKQEMENLENQKILKEKVIDNEKIERLKRVEMEKEEELQKLNKEKLVNEDRKLLEEIIFALDKFRVSQNADIRMQKVEGKIDRMTKEEKFHHDRVRNRVECKTMLHDEESRYRRVINEIANIISSDRLTEKFIVTALPEISKSLGNQFEKIQYVNWNSGNGKNGDSLGFMANSFNQILQIAKLHGVDISKLLNKY